MSNVNYGFPKWGGGGGLIRVYIYFFFVCRELKRVYHALSHPNARYGSGTLAGVV